jgi:Domain of unknown function (DUF4281)
MLLDQPDALFSAAGALALSGWLALALSPARMAWALPARRYAGRVVPLVMALLYGALIVRHWGPGGFGSLAEVRALFDVPQLLLAGWVHYLAFDLFVGAWIAERGPALGMPHWLLLPLWLLTFLFGPAGLLAFMALRTLPRFRAVSTSAEGSAA